MPSDLKGLVDKNLEANKKYLKRGGLKSSNQETNEFNLKRRVKTGLICAAVISALGLGIYGFNYCWHKRESYVTEQERKMVRYQRQFDDVKYYYNHKDYVKADDLSEKLQDEMSKESFFSPTKALYKKVKNYDNEYIDPEIRKIRNEQFYRDIKAIPERVKNKLGEKWSDIPPGGKFIIYACGAGLIIYLLRRR